MRVLVACEYSGRVRDAFIRNGHDAISADLLPTDQPGPHYQGDIFDLINSERFDLMVAHPPCTYLANSGVRWLYDQYGYNWPRWEALRDATEFFNRVLNAPIERIAVENPIQHKWAAIRSADQIMQPWQFGHGETKATQLWLKNLPQLKPTDIVDGRHAYVHRLPPTADRWKLRSTTYQGIADAMGDQWGNL